MANSEIEHSVSIVSSGNDYQWSCTCGKTSRHQLPYYRTARNARAHETKSRRAAINARNGAIP